jgi:DNA replication protein DnaC
MTYQDISKDAPTTLTQAEKNKLYAQLNAKEREDWQEYQDSIWLTLCPSQYNKPLDYSKISANNHAQVKAVIAWQNFPKGLFIIGPTGRAKTRACWAALKPRWYAGAKIHFASSFQVAQDAVKAMTDHERGQKIVPRYVNADILFLDDLGKRLTPSASQFLFEVIERRTNNDKPIIATSNEDFKTLAEKIDDGSGTMSEPVIRRFEEFCDLVVMP